MTSVSRRRANRQRRTTIETRKMLKRSTDRHCAGRPTTSRHARRAMAKCREGGSQCRSKDAAPSDERTTGEDRIYNTRTVVRLEKLVPRLRDIAERRCSRLPFHPTTDAARSTTREYIGLFFFLRPRKNVFEPTVYHKVVIYGKVLRNRFTTSPSDQSEQ